MVPLLDKVPCTIREPVPAEVLRMVKLPLLSTVRFLQSAVSVGPMARVEALEDISGMVISSVARGTDAGLQLASVCHDDELLPVHT